MVKKMTAKARAELLAKRTELLNQMLRQPTNMVEYYLRDWKRHLGKVNHCTTCHCPPKMLNTDNDWSIDMTARCLYEQTLMAAHFARLVLSQEDAPVAVDPPPMGLA